QTTRLFVRESISANRPEGSVGATVSKLTWDPIHFVMVQRMLRGIAERVEERPLVPTSLQLVARLGWTLAALGLAVLFLRRRRGFLWLLIPVAAIVPSLVSTRDLNSGIAGFLAVGITLLGALSFRRCWWPAFTWLVAAVLLVLLLAPDAYTA